MLDKFTAMSLDGDSLLSKSAAKRLSSELYGRLEPALANDAVPAMVAILMDDESFRLSLFQRRCLTDADHRSAELDLLLMGTSLNSSTLEVGFLTEVAFELARHVDKGLQLLTLGALHLNDELRKLLLRVDQTKALPVVMFVLVSDMPSEVLPIDDAIEPWLEGDPSGPKPKLNMMATAPYLCRRKDGRLVEVRGESV